MNVWTLHEEDIVKSVPTESVVKDCTAEESPLSEAIPPHARVIHVGAPPTILRTCPLAPFTSHTVFPARASQLLNMKRSEKSPLPELYDIPPVAESEMSEILELNEFQSATEREPVVELLARVIESC